MAATVKGYSGIAFYDPEPCEEHSGCAVVVMIGDDRRRHVFADSVQPLDDGEYCPSCGQIGCKHYL